jgi:RimJ/RimL family protein N-acetyltransferase
VIHNVEVILLSKQLRKVIIFAPINTTFAVFCKISKKCITTRKSQDTFCYSKNLKNPSTKKYDALYCFSSINLVSCYYIGSFIARIFYTLNIMEIRKIDQKEWQSWKEIRLEALKDAPDSFLSTYEEEVESKDQFWIDQVKNNDVIIAFVENKPVGCCVFSIDKRSRMNHIAVMWSMYVGPSIRGTGSGYKIVRFIQDYGRGKVKQIHLDCNASNHNAADLYRKCGFRVYGTKPAYIRIGNRFHDDFIMCYHLD